MPTIPTTMRAWQYATPASSTGLENTLTLHPTTPLPPLPSSPPSVLVKVLRMALNPVDYKVAETPLLPQLTGLPVTPSMDAVGRVAKSTDPAFAEGDLVVVKHSHPGRFGTAAEYTVVGGRDAVVKVDEAGIRVLDELAGSGVAAGTAAVSLKGIKKGDKVFINGSSGGVGVWAVQMAKADGYEVVATCSGRNVELVKSLGADEVIDYTQTSVVSALKENVARTGRPFDRAIDNVATDMSLYFQSHEYLAPAAAYMIVGGYMSLRFLLTALKVHLLPGFLGGGKRKVVRILENGGKEEIGWAVELALEGKIRLPVSKFEFEEFPEAMKAIKTGRTVGKIVVKVADDQA